jgi:hypothetical protein
MKEVYGKKHGDTSHNQRIRPLSALGSGFSIWAWAMWPSSALERAWSFSLPAGYVHGKSDARQPDSDRYHLPLYGIGQQGRPRKAELSTRL